MRSFHKNRVAPLLAAMLSVVTLAGCPELNQWSGPSQDPFFSVADPLQKPVLRNLTEPEGKMLPQPILQTSSTAAVR